MACVLGIAGAAVLALAGSGSTGREQASEANALFAASRAVGIYQDVALAQRDGYLPVTDVLPGSAMHYVSQRNLDDGGFNLTQPEVLLYDDDSRGGLELVGVAYLLPQAERSATPPSAFGPDTHWHAHHYRWPCLLVQADAGPETVDEPDVACRQAGNIVFPTRFWMLHVWLFRPSPGGTFSETNKTVVPREWLVEGQVQPASDSSSIDRAP
jgi:hypothetical protein